MGYTLKSMSYRKKKFIFDAGLMVAGISLLDRYSLTRRKIYGMVFT
jgi:hypothetical protein